MVSPRPGLGSKYLCSGPWQRAGSAPTPPPAPPPFRAQRGKVLDPRAIQQSSPALSRGLCTHTLSLSLACVHPLLWAQCSPQAGAAWHCAEGSSCTVPTWSVWSPMTEAGTDWFWSHHGHSQAKVTFRAGKPGFPDSAPASQSSRRRQVAPPAGRAAIWPPKDFKQPPPQFSSLLLLWGPAGLRLQA